MITFVWWKWVGPDSNRAFHSSHVNQVKNLVHRFSPFPHRFVCITDDPRGLDNDIEPLPLPSMRFEDLENPYQTRYRRGRALHTSKRFPNCYRRLWNFSMEAKRALGGRIFQLDIDVIPCNDLSPLVARTADFVGWCDERFEWKKVAGGAYLLTTGSHPQVWEKFDPHTSPALAKSAGLGGSDQAWMSYLLYPPAQHWSSADGVVKINWLGQGITQPPPGARLVFTGGHCPPWMPEVQRRYPWVKKFWRA